MDRTGSVRLPLPLLARGGSGAQASCVGHSPRCRCPAVHTPASVPLPPATQWPAQRKEHVRLLCGAQLWARAAPSRRDSRYRAAGACLHEEARRGDAPVAGHIPDPQKHKEHGARHWAGGGHEGGGKVATSWRLHRRAFRLQLWPQEPCNACSAPCLLAHCHASPGAWTAPPGTLPQAGRLGSARGSAWRGLGTMKVPCRCENRSACTQQCLQGLRCVAAAQRSTRPAGAASLSKPPVWQGHSRNCRSPATRTSTAAGSATS